MTEKQSPADAGKEPKTVEITLLAPHTHRGVEYVKGDKIAVREDQANRLIHAKRAQ